MNARGRGLSGILFLPCYPLFIFLIWFGCLFLPCSAFIQNPVAFKLKTKRRKSKCRHNATSVLLWRKEGREGREKPWTKNTNKRVEEGGGHVKGEISTVNSQWKEGGRILFLLARRDFVLCITVGLCTVERLRYQGNSSLPFCPSPLFFLTFLSFTKRTYSLASPAALATATIVCVRENSVYATFDSPFFIVHLHHRVLCQWQFSSPFCVRVRRERRHYNFFVRLGGRGWE